MSSPEAPRMNYAEFRRRLLIDPTDPALHAAAQGLSADSTERLSQAVQLEARLQQALALPLPADLAAGIEARLAQERDRVASGLRPRPWWMALAAALLLSLGLGLWWSQLRSLPMAELATAVVAHLAHEPYALTRSSQVPPTLVRRMLIEHGLQPASEPVPVEYLQRCLVAGRWTVHMVMQEADGPVTVLYMPALPNAQRMDLRQDATAVRSLPYGDGALWLMAESNRDFDAVEQAWLRSAGQTVAGGWAAGAD